MSNSATKNNTLYACGIVLIAFLLKFFFLGIHDLFVEEAYYWNYSIHLDWGYLDHPPMVALLIKLSTWAFGINEFGVRFPTLICSLITAYYSYQLAEQLCKGTGLYAVMLVAILPFFFLFSLVMTPDLPLMACWSAAIYYLYKALCLNQATAWYATGVAVGLGLSSKYSIVLLIFATFIYMLLTPQARAWFLRKEPYFASCIVFIFFTPVIYWNATHDWMSFAFQSTRRFRSTFTFSFHELMALLLAFLTPIGMVGLWRLFVKPTVINDQTEITHTSKHFMRIFFLVPFLVFASFSLTREIKCNWIGPAILAVIPWLAFIMQNHSKTFRHWKTTSTFLLIFYLSLLSCMSFSFSSFLSRTLLSKYIDWGNFTLKFHDIAQTFEKDGRSPIFMPLDSYSIASELYFYQTKYFYQHKINKIYPIQGASIFGLNSLMYDLWYKNDNLADKSIILIAKLPTMLETTQLHEKAAFLAPAKQIWSSSQNKNDHIKKFYYQPVRIK